MYAFDKRSSGGQILILALLASALLAGLVFYVVNVGDLLNRKVAMQNAADAAAISGASWMARSMNVVAMNNVAQTRMLTLVPVLDAFPLSVKMAFEETDAWVGCLDAQLSRGVPDDRLKQGLQSLRGRIGRQRDVLGPMNGFLNPGGVIGAPVTPVTTYFIRGYVGPPPHGSLWQAAQSLDEFSQAACVSAGVLAQADAVRWGRADGAETAFIVPVVPQLPARRTDFGGWERPIKTGRIPDHADHKRLGPYDRLFLWRRWRYQDITEPDKVVSGNPGHGPIRGVSRTVTGAARSNGRSAMGYTTNPNDHWTYRTVGRILMGYTVYGPYTWMMDRIHGYAQGWWQDRGYRSGELSDTFFHEYHRNIADAKLGYLWGSQAEKTIHYPLYWTDYNFVKQQLTARPEIQVTRTMFYVVEIRSKYPKDSPSYLSGGSFVTNGDLPIAQWMNGWKDPDTWKIPKIADHIWEEQWEYETTEDSEIGIRKEPDPANPGHDKWQKVYMISQYVFGGVDVGSPFPVSNPANFTDRNELTAPILMDTAYGDYDLSLPHHDLGVRREVFTYLGVAKRPNDPMVWGVRFGSGNPFPGVAAAAQAEIFNTRSWDLWTQDWKVKLVPVTGWQEWTQRMAVGVADASLTHGMVDAQAVQDIQEYFSRFDAQMVSRMMNH